MRILITDKGKDELTDLTYDQNPKSNNFSVEKLFREKASLISFKNHNHKKTQNSFNKTNEKFNKSSLLKSTDKSIIISQKKPVLSKQMIDKYLECESSNLIQNLPINLHRKLNISQRNSDITEINSLKNSFNIREIVNEKGISNLKQKINLHKQIKKKNNLKVLRKSDDDVKEIEISNKKLEKLEINLENVNLINYISNKTDMSINFSRKLSKITQKQCYYDKISLKCINSKKNQEIDTRHFKEKIDFEKKKQFLSFGASLTEIGKSLEKNCFQYDEFIKLRKEKKKEMLTKLHQEIQKKYWNTNHRIESKDKKPFITDIFTEG